MFKTGKEDDKFGTLYSKACEQTICNMINVLAINTDSKSHDFCALSKFVHLNQLVRRSDTARSKWLSGVLLTGGRRAAGSEPNILWCDPKACHTIPEDIRLALRRMV